MIFREIWNVFQSVSDLSMETTKTLDNVYYSILEKLDTLRSTVSGMQKLADKTKTLGVEFDRDAKNVKSEVEQQLHVFEGFERPKQKIESLESRVKNSKERTEALTTRLQAARDRVKALENQEEEVQASITCKFSCIRFDIVH
jgi:predicted  nucleic acid-binding Zn-ribbon protein